MNILIVGASRGIGLGLAQRLSQSGHQVVATTRGARREPGAITWEYLDILEVGKPNSFVKKQSIAGVSHIVIAAGVMPEGIDNNLLPEDVAKVFLTNSVAPVDLAEKLIEALEVPPRAILFLGSVMSSISLNETGDSWIYRASKSALTSGVKSLAMRHQALPTRFLVVHPGWVKTDMGGIDADIDISVSTEGLENLIYRTENFASFEFVDYLGKSIDY